MYSSKKISMDVLIFHTPHTPQTPFEPHKPPQTPFEPHKPCLNPHKPRLNPADVLKPHRHFKHRIYPATTQHNGRSGLRRDSDGRQAGFGPIPHHGFPVFLLSERPMAVGDKLTRSSYFVLSVCQFPPSKLLENSA